MKRDLVFDVGLHQGEDSEFYLKKGFNVVAIEANPILCQIARERFQDYCATGCLTILNLAIAEKSGPTTFFMNEKVSVWGTTSVAWANRNEKLGARSSEVTVDGVEFAALLERFGVPYYLKIDIEGADLLCVEALKHIASRPKYLSIESSKTVWSDLIYEFDLLTRLGYSKFKLVNQEDVPKQKCPFPPQEGAYIDHAFSVGASGLFGGEVPGSWLSREQAIFAYRLISTRYKLFGDAGILNGMRKRVSRLPLLRRLEKHMRAGWYDTHASL